MSRSRLDRLEPTEKTRIIAGLLNPLMRPEILWDGMGDVEILWPPLPEAELLGASRIARGLHPYREPG